MAQGIAVALLIATALYLGWCNWRGKDGATVVAALTDRYPVWRVYLGWGLAALITGALPALYGMIPLKPDGAPPWAAMPAEFMSLASVPGSFPVAGLLIALLAGSLLAMLLSAYRAQRGLPALEIFSFPLRKPIDVRELLAAALLALASGVSDGLLYRLFVPLLIVLVFGHPLIAFIVAQLVCTAMHRRTSVREAVMVGLFAALYTSVYLMSGALWLSILVHVVVNLNGSVLGPLARWPWLRRTD